VVPSFVTISELQRGHDIGKILLLNRHLPGPRCCKRTIEVAGVQATPDDARQPGEDEPFIINGSFGD
jgi:hypothetical protein